MDRRCTVRTGKRRHYRTGGEQGGSVRQAVGISLTPHEILIIHSRSQVTLEEATTKATQLNIMFMETSAKAGHNVKSLFKKIAMSLPGMEKDTQTEPNTSPPVFFVSNWSFSHSVLDRD